MIDKRISKLAMMLASGFVLSCTSAPKKEVPMGAIVQARWETKLRVKDLKKEKTNSVSVDVLGKRGGPFRMEASAILGYPVASYVMDQSGFKCAVYPEKKFYEGNLSEEALQPLLKVPMSPVVLRQIAFDEPLSGSVWKCAKGADGHVESCVSAASQTKVAWKREGANRSVRIEAPGFEMDWVFGLPQTDVQFKEGTFHLEAPQGFKVIRL